MRGEIRRLQIPLYDTNGFSSDFIPNTRSCHLATKDKAPNRNVMMLKRAKHQATDCTQTLS